MSRPTRAPERHDPQAPGVTPHAGGSPAAPQSSQQRPTWTATRALTGVCGALVLLSLVGPSWVGRPTRATNAPDTTAPATTPTPTHAAAEGTPTASAAASVTAPGSSTASAVPEKASGRTQVLTVPGEDTRAQGRTVRYVVEVEEGAGVDGAEFAAMVRRVLTDERGWETQDKVHFVNVPPEQVGRVRPDVRITLASPATVDAMCAPLQTDGQVSCRNGDRVALNSLRWTQGVEYYAGDLTRYRIYLINHEVGHAIGHDHEACPGRGKPAPVMLQQTLGLQGCTRYPWPVPGRPA